MAAIIARVYRYPVKGLSAEPLDRVALAIGRCLPQDRRYAITLGSTHFDPAQPKWLAKTNFIMLMRDETLARLSTRFDPRSELLTIAVRGVVLLEARLSDPDGRRAVARFFEDFLGEAVIRPLRVVEAPDHAFADARAKPNASTGQYVSLINLSSALQSIRSVSVPTYILRDCLHGRNNNGSRPSTSSRSVPPDCSS
jgi:uncharacterized protein YcbX